MYDLLNESIVGEYNLLITNNQFWSVMRLMTYSTLWCWKLKQTSQLKETLIAIMVIFIKTSTSKPLLIFKKNFCCDLERFIVFYLQLGSGCVALSQL